MLPVQPIFPPPSRMLYEALRRLSPQTPSAPELFDEIHRLYPSIPRPRAHRITPPRVENGITIPSPKVEAMYPDHPVRSLEVLDAQILTSLRNASLINLTWDKKKRRHGYIFNPSYPAPLPPSTTRPSFSSATAVHKGEGELSWLGGRERPSSSSSATPVADALSASASSSSSNTTPEWSPILDSSGYPLLPPRWQSFTHPLLTASPPEKLAAQVGLWRQITSLRPLARAVVLSHRPKDRPALLALSNDEIVAVGVQPPTKRDPAPDKRPVKNEKDQLVYELKLFSGLSKRKQRVAVPKELAFRRWREEREMSWVAKGGDALYEVQGLMDFRREEGERLEREREVKRADADAKSREEEAARLGRERTLAEGAREKMLYGEA